MKSKWRIYVSKAHEEGLPCRVTQLFIRMNYIADPMPCQLFELLSAFYHMLNNSPDRRVRIRLPSSSSPLGNLMVYDERLAMQETPESSLFYVTLEKQEFPQETRLDMRLFKPFTLFPPNNLPNLAVYTITGSIDTEDSLAWARYTAVRLNASYRLRAALVDLYHLLENRETPRLKRGRLSSISTEICFAVHVRDATIPHNK